MPYLVYSLLFVVSLSHAQTVYRTVDERGVVSFSDSPPQGDVLVEEMHLNVPQPAPGDEYQENLQAMRETTDRMAQDRRDREKHRAEIRELEARASAYETPPQQEPYRDYGSYYPNYYPLYRPPRPVRPWKPPLRPGHPELYSRGGASVSQPPLRTGHGNNAHHSLRKGTSLQRRR